MKKTLSLHQDHRKRGSYRRKDFVGDVLYYSFIYREFHITFAKKGRKNTILSDSIADALLERGYVSSQEYLAYKQRVCECFSLETLKEFDDYTLEELYTFIAKIREEQFGKKRLNLLWLDLAKSSQCLDFKDCLDQRKQIEKACLRNERILVALTEPELFATMMQVLSSEGLEQKEIFFITSESGEKNLPSVTDLSDLSGQETFSYLVLKENALQSEENFDISSATLLVFGETGLLDARNLRIPCGIYSTPRGYHAAAVAGQLGLLRPCAVFVPAGFSIVESVPVTKPTRLSYLILSKLANDLGEEIYSLPIEVLYARFPEYFINVYETDTSARCDDALCFSYPGEALSFDEFDRLRGAAIQKHLDGFSNCRYFTRLYTEETNGIQGKILVHGVRIRKSDCAAVIPCGKATPLRKNFRDLDGKGTGIVSNFLFFLTPKLATLYNSLRMDRPEEQAEVDAGHLDYLLEYRDGKRVETFPLFRKTCIALKDDGEFLFFNFRLGGGMISINEIPFSWNKDAVDPNSGSAIPPVAIFTPYSSLPDRDADRETYRKTVGENRLNFVLIQDRITAIRDGDVILPGMGVVISLEKGIGERLCEKIGLVKDEKGYFDPSSIKIDVHLEAPEGISEEDWKKVKWAYGGGLSLILDGVGLCDDDRLEEWFENDGWTSPLSRQTQESALHTLAKHPRTAIGTTKSGELVILVFSGRTEASSGADYSEMCIIARDLIPDIRYLMNVDGGGSAMLGLVRNGEFLELSLPSTSTGSTVGMVRPINTVLHVPIK